MSRTHIDIVKDDKLYDLNFTLQDASSVAVDLTNATLKLKVQKSGDTELTLNGTMNIVDAESGTCKYQVQDKDFDEEGVYDAEIEVTFLDGQVSTWTGIIINVKADLPE